MDCFGCGGTIEDFDTHYEVEVRKVHFTDGPAPYENVKLESKLTMQNGKLCKNCLFNWRKHSMLNPIGG
jgi:hypothetical protein